MNYKKFFIGLTSTSALVVLTHELTKYHERSINDKFYQDKLERQKEIENNLREDNKILIDVKNDLMKKTRFLSKKVYHINNINIIDEINYINNKMSGKRKEYEISKLEFLFEKLCNTETNDELNCAIRNISSFKEDVRNIINEQDNDNDENIYEILKKYKNNDYNSSKEDNIYRIIETKIRLLEKMSKLQSFSYLKDSIDELNKTRKDYMKLRDDLTYENQVNIDKVADNLLRPAFCKMKNIIFEYESSLSEVEKRDFEDLILKTYNMLNTDKFSDAEICLNVFINTFKAIINTIVNNYENNDIHVKIHEMISHCRNIIFLQIEKGIFFSLEEYSKRYPINEEIIKLIFDTKTL